MLRPVVSLLIRAWLLTQLLFVGAGTTPILWASQEQKQLFKQCKITTSWIPCYSFFTFVGPQHAVRFVDICLCLCLYYYIAAQGLM